MTALATTEQVTENVFRDSEGRAVTTSLAVAERFGKNHKHVLRDIENLGCPDDFNQSNFGLIDYTDKRGRKQKAVSMTRDGFTVLVMGYTGADAMQYKIAYISAFNALEEQAKKPALDLTDPHQLLQYYATKQVEMKRELDAAAPAIEYHEAHKATDDEMCLTAYAKTVSKDIKLTYNKICQKYMYKRFTNKGEGFWVPLAEYSRKDWFTQRVTAIPRSDGTVSEKATPLITSKGRRGVFEYLKKEFPELLNL